MGEVNFAIDPGVDMGWSKWDGPVLVAAGVIYGPKHTAATNSWFEALSSGVQRLDRLMFHGFVNSGACVIEYPAFFDTHGGHTTARSGSLVKLAISVGMIAAAAVRCGLAVKFVDVCTWKGQLPKSVVEARIRKLLMPRERKVPLKTHAWDAVGLGLWYHGRFE